MPRVPTSGVSFRALVAALFGAASCAGGASADIDRATNDLSAHGGTDVQVISVRSGSAIEWSLGTTRFDATKCVFSDRMPASGGGGFNVNAKADCTDALITGAGMASMNKYVEPLASLREVPNLTNVSMRHWCSTLELTVAVKASAWDAASFEGIGFYGHDPTVDENDADRRTFYAKSDRRLVRTGEAALKNEGGQRAYLYKFTGAGPCEVNGTGRNPTQAVDFKPYASFSGGVESWEAVPENHQVRFQEAWDRSSQLLQ